VPCHIIWPVIQTRFNLTDRWEHVMRVSLVLLTMVCAMVVPHLDLLISLIGAFASTLLALVLPAIIELITMLATTDGVKWYIWVKNIFILILGIIGFTTGTYSSLSQIIQAF